MPGSQVPIGNQPNLVWGYFNAIPGNAYVMGDARGLRCDANGFLQVGMAPGAMFDINVAQIAGVATQAAGGTMPLAVWDGAAWRSYLGLASGSPVIDLNTIRGTLVVTAGVNGLLAVGGNVANDAADAGNPVSIGGRVFLVDPAAMAAGDRAVIRMDQWGFLRQAGREHDYPISANRVAEVAPLSSRWATQTLLNVANVNTGGGAVTFDIYLDWSGYTCGSLQFEISAPADPVVCTIWASDQDDGTLPAECTYQDVTLGLFGAATITATSYCFVDTCLAIKYMRVRAVVGPGGANTSDVWIMSKQMYC